VLTRGALGTAVGGALRAGHVVVVERHGSSDRRGRGHRTETTWGSSTAKIVAAHLLWVLHPVVHHRVRTGRPVRTVRPVHRAVTTPPPIRSGAPVDVWDHRMIG
jgi:hypothetical protein